jgi:hypothetical protein
VTETIVLKAVMTLLFRVCKLEEERCNREAKPSISVRCNNVGKCSEPTATNTSAKCEEIFKECIKIKD